MLNLWQNEYKIEISIEIQTLLRPTVLIMIKRYQQESQKL